MILIKGPRRAANTLSCRDWRYEKLAMIIGHLQAYAGFNEDAVLF